MQSGRVIGVLLVAAVLCAAATTWAEGSSRGGNCLDGTSPSCAQPPMGADGLSFRADGFFPTGDDFTCATDDPIVGVRWWGTISDETAPHDTSALVPFNIRFYSSSGGLPGTQLASATVDAVEAWTGEFCRGIEGDGGGNVCVGPEPLYVYEACFDPPFVPEPGVEYWVVIKNLNDAKPAFWAIHEAGVDHPTGNEAATFGFFGFESGVINACPGDFGSLVGPYDLAFELLISEPSPVPALSARGLALLALLTLAAATIVLRRRARTHTQA